MDVHRSDTMPTARGPKDWFTGTVWMDRIIEAPAPARVRAVRVSFEPGARTAWHRHPLGQTLHVLLGLGRVQSRGGPVRSIRPGDTVWIPPGEEHWHGAAPSAGMVHLAIHEADEEGSTTVWLEQVSETEYGGTPAAD
jgi:quercetin dioxygenase-like cupin family protein